MGKKQKFSTTLGDAVNAFNLLNTLVFMATVVGQFYGYIDILDPSFLKDGFCVANQDKSIWMQSHAMCFYGDTAFALIIWLLVQYAK